MNFLNLVSGNTSPAKTIFSGVETNMTSVMDDDAQSVNSSIQVPAAPPPTGPNTVVGEQLPTADEINRHIIPVLKVLADVRTLQLAEPAASPELRKQIYEHALVSPEPVDLLASGEPPLLRTSRQMREESGLLFYSSNDFRLVVSQNQAENVTESLRRCLASSHNLKKLESMGHLEVEYHLSSSENIPAGKDDTEGECIELAVVLAGCGSRENQVSWRAVSTNFSDPAFGNNYLEWLAQSARLHVYSSMLVRDWEEAHHQRHSEASSETNADITERLRT
ncbi:uncharacterized protein CLAFUR5_04179 [Fulvia fulva]|uniref:Uncharacterized protein n=1 Tax=Passalora fulva TaxID=5499 RepID=A0A9Q8LF63_PASFU|nr:uncharacterized protein CLAFUR5_04179 [Fulvia fulva]KAK4628366.1 hypothetical protein CLAFUR0_04201 [Fulvia fulva]UJO16089.1 hypothetical protein CLAFUR5_04179 [Fulvia fulva]